MILLCFCCSNGHSTTGVEERGKHHIWKGNTVSDSALRTLLYRLRGKLEYLLIETVPSFGFRISPTL